MSKLITYLARPFEQATNEQTKTGSWITKINNGFDKRKIYIYDAAIMEAVKTGLGLNKHIDNTHPTQDPRLKQTRTSGLLDVIILPIPAINSFDIFYRLAIS